MRGIPALYYHRINEIDASSQAITPARFDEQMNFLSHSGWRSLAADELAPYMKKEKRPEKHIVITFDDGYLDNWVYAYPILKKYGMKATIFLITDRITDLAGSPRPNLSDVADNNMTLAALPRIMSFDEANRKGLGSEADKSEAFLTWAEVKAMYSSGLVSFDSHSHTHGAHYVGSRIVGFIDSERPHWTRVLPTGGEAAVGMPRYEKASVLVGLRFYDDPGFRAFITRHIESRGGIEYMKKNGKKQALKEVAALERQWSEEHGSNGRFEEDSERRERVMNELSTSRRIIGEQLGRPPTTISWPWGEYDDVSAELAREAGYMLGFSTRPGANWPGDDPYGLRRIKVGPWSADGLQRRLNFLTGQAGRITRFFN